MMMLAQKYTISGKDDSENVVVENIHLGDSLMTLCYEVKNRATRPEGEKEKA